MFYNEEGVDTLYVTIKGSFQINGKVEISPTQAPIILNDTYWEDGQHSSLKYAGEVHPVKPSTDVVIVGKAFAPLQKPVKVLPVQLCIHQAKKILVIFGDRVWEKRLIGIKASEPKPFIELPIRYEYAFGGSITLSPNTPEKKRISHPKNPVGKGFFGKRSRLEMMGQMLPNIENPDELVVAVTDSPDPVGFGYIAPFWWPRFGYAGTYDEEWQKKRAPYLPTDFNARYHNAAHPDLILNGYLKGGESIGIDHMSHKGKLNFHLPVTSLNVTFLMDNRKIIQAPHIETLLIEPNEEKFFILWRAALACDKKALKVRETQIELNQFTIK